MIIRCFPCTEAGGGDGGGIAVRNLTFRGVFAVGLDGSAGLTLML